MKIGLVKEGFAVCDSDVSSTVHKTALKLKDKGAAVEEVSIPIHDDGKYNPTIHNNAILL